jgi:hypothetical protein
MGRKFLLNDIPCPCGCGKMLSLPATKYKVTLKSPVDTVVYELEAYSVTDACRDAYKRIWADVSRRRNTYKHCVIKEIRNLDQCKRGWAML